MAQCGLDPIDLGHLLRLRTPRCTGASAVPLEVLVALEAFALGRIVLLEELGEHLR